MHYDDLLLYNQFSGLRHGLVGFIGNVFFLEEIRSDQTLQDETTIFQRKSLL